RGVQVEGEGRDGGVGGVGGVRRAGRDMAPSISASECPRSPIRVSMTRTLGPDTSPRQRPDPGTGAGETRIRQELERPSRSPGTEGRKIRSKASHIVLEKGRNRMGRRIIRAMPPQKMPFHGGCRLLTTTTTPNPTH